MTEPTDWAAIDIAVNKFRQRTDDAASRWADSYLLAIRDAARSSDPELLAGALDAAEAAYRGTLAAERGQ